MGSRFLLYGAIFLHIAIALFLAENWPEWWRKPRRYWKLGFVLLIFLPSLPFRAAEAGQVAADFGHLVLGIPRHESVAERFDFLSRVLSPSAVVMAEEEAGWPVPAVSGAKIVWQQKGNPLITPELNQRKEDAIAFFRRPLSLDERRALLKRYHVTHILLETWWHDRWDRSFFEQLPELATLDSTRGFLALYKARY